MTTLLSMVSSLPSDHLTSSSHLLHSYFISYRKKRIANGSFSSIARKRAIRLTGALPSQSVLHVLELACNLLSVGKLYGDSNCCVTSFESYHIFNIVTQGRKLGARMLEWSLLLQQKFFYL